MLEKELIAEKVTEDTAKKMKMRSGLVGSNPKVSSRNAKVGSKSFQTVGEQASASNAQQQLIRQLDEVDREFDSLKSRSC